LLGIEQTRVATHTKQSKAKLRVCKQLIVRNSKSFLIFLSSSLQLHVPFTSSCPLKPFRNKKVGGFAIIAKQNVLEIRLPFKTFSFLV